MHKSTLSAGVRERLLAAAIEVLEREGPEALQARRLTAEIGASTMAVYTHFGGMSGLVEAVVRDGLARFAAHVREVPDSDDPLTDLIAGGIAYGGFALANPQLYRLIFGLTGKTRRGGRVGGLDAATVWALPEGADAFSVLQRSIDRVIAEGQIRPQDARDAAIQVLSVTHGYLLLALGGMIDDDGRGVIVPLTVNLMVGLGASREHTEEALARAASGRSWLRNL
jgi:AcrR family transcriptional regulator